MHNCLYQERMTDIIFLPFHFSARAKRLHQRGWDGERHTHGCDVDLPGLCSVPDEAQLPALRPQRQACKQ